MQNLAITDINGLYCLKLERDSGGCNQGTVSPGSFPIQSNWASHVRFLSNIK